MARISTQSMNDRKLSMLGLIALYSQPGEGAQITRATIMRTLNLSHIQSRWLLMRMVEEGLVTMRNSFDERGGQLGNVFEITPEGYEFARNNA